MTDQTSNSFLLLRSTQARKVGQRATGKIQYEILCDIKRESVFIRITGNEGGGYFSREKIDFDETIECVTGLDSGRALPSKAFAAAFVGRSSNNAGFLAAVLRAEGLLDAAPGTDFQHVISGDWSAWKNETLKLDGTPLVEPVAAAGARSPSDSSSVEGASVAEHKEHTKDPKNRKAQAPVKRQ